MRRPLSLLAATLLALPLAAADAPPAKKPLTLEAAYGAVMAGYGGGLQGLAWRDATHLTFVTRDGEGEKSVMALFEWDAKTGTRTKLLEPLPLPGPTPGDAAEKKSKTLPLSGASWNKAGTALLLHADDDLWVYDVASKRLTRLTEDAAEEEYATFSPDGSHVAFVRTNDLWVVDVATKKTQRLTTDGSETVLNGKLDWVYEEELANRRSGRAYEWTPDGKAIGFLRLDDGPVPPAVIVDYLPTHAKLEPQRYPKPGDPNPVPSVHLVALDGARHDVAFPGEDVLVGPEFSFTRDGAFLCYLVLDRTQTKAEVRLLGRDGAKRALLAESDPAWINSIEPPEFLADGSFLFSSERTGFLHLYRYGKDGRLANAVTKGAWVIDRAPEVDEKGGWVYVVANEADPRERQVYRARLDGTGFTRLTKERGTHTLLLSPGGGYFVDTHGNVETPSRTVVREAATGRELSVLFTAKNRLEEFATGPVELGSFRGKDGTLFYTKLVKPAGFDPTKKYPVIVSVYGGPHQQVVRDAWSPRDALDHVLAARGFLVFSMDNRGSWGRGHAFETPLLKRTGAVELADQVEGVAWLKRNPWVDGAHVGIVGGSYGGYMTLYALTHASDTFKAGVAISSVTDWKYYDSIYTERYMKMPKENEAGYQASSVLESAKDLGGKLLIEHGTSDDNVHLQNSIAFMDAAMRARKTFEFLPFARQKHSFRDPALRVYSYTAMLDFFARTLQP